MKNIFALSLLLVAGAAVAMEPVKEATEPIAKVAEVAKEAVQAGAEKAKEAGQAVAQEVAKVGAKVADAAKDATAHVHKSGIFHSLEHAFKDGVSFANAQWAQIAKTSSTLKSTGWNALNKNEKIGVAVAGTAIVAATAYVVYKLYQAANKTEKEGKVSVNVRQLRY